MYGLNISFLVKSPNARHTWNRMVGNCVLMVMLIISCARVTGEQLLTIYLAYYVYVGPETLEYLWPLN